MASLPLFSPSSSFVPNGGASFARPAKRASAADPLASATRSRSRATMRSLFDPMPFVPPKPASHRLRAAPVVPVLVVPPPVVPAPVVPAPVVPAPLVHPSVLPAPVVHGPVDPPPVAPPTSLVERTEVALREAGLAGQFWRGDALSMSPLPSTPSGFRALDEELPGGGWPSRCLTELLLSHTGVGEIRFLASTLSSLTRAGREIVLLSPPHVPDPTGWEQLGIDMRHVLIVRTERPADRLWAVEQSIKSSAFGALLAWLPEEKVLARHDALRRLQSLAASANGLTFLMRPAIAQYQASPAALRLTLSTGKPEGERRTLSVRLIKRRGPVLAKPLTLMPPAVHRGLKAFRLDASSSASSFPSSSSSSFDSSSASSSSSSSASSSASSSVVKLGGQQTLSFPRSLPRQEVSREREPSGVRVKASTAIRHEVPAFAGMTER